MELLLPNEAINAFTMWEAKVEKTEYWGDKNARNIERDAVNKLAKRFET